MLATIHSIPAFGIELEDRGLEPVGHTTRLVRLVESMGTAFGLDAITTIQPETAAEAAARERAAPPSRIEHRLHRRSTF